MMKIFTIEKIGYSTGVYGWTGDFHILTVSDEKGIRLFYVRTGYEGDYGIVESMKEKGYTRQYASVSPLFQVKRDNAKVFGSFEDIIDKI